VSIKNKSHLVARSVCPQPVHVRILRRNIIAVGAEENVETYRKCIDA
jgi:hypothetical protein